MRSVVTVPVTEFVQLLPVTLGSVPLQTYFWRALMIAGLAKPIDTWNRAGIQSGIWIDRSGQAVRQRHVEHVVGHLPGRITRAAGIVEEGDVEAAQAGLVGRQHEEAAAGIVLTVEREVVFEYEHREFR